MEEKYMVNDLLNNLKDSIKFYTELILESENIQLRTVTKDLRNYLENFQYDLLKISESKGYYIKIDFAEPKEIEKIKNDLNLE